MAEYRIDYDNVDVDDLMEQVRVRARGHEGAEPALPELREEIRSRLRDYLMLDDAQPYELQQRLELVGPWNVAPEDLRSSHPGPLGRLIRSVRRLARPLVKIFVNLDEPLHKQFKVNLGVAAALHDLMEENAALRRRLEELSARVDAPESRDA